MSRDRTGMSGIHGFRANETGFNRDWQYLNNKFHRIATITADDERYGIGFSLTVSNIAGGLPIIEKSRIKRRYLFHRQCYICIDVGIDLLFMEERQRRHAFYEMMNEATNRLAEFANKRIPNGDIERWRTEVLSVLEEYLAEEELPEVIERPLTAEEIELIEAFKQTGRIPPHLNHLRREPR